MSAKSLLMPPKVRGQHGLLLPWGGQWAEVRCGEVGCFPAVLCLRGHSPRTAASRILPEEGLFARGLLWFFLLVSLELRALLTNFLCIYFLLFERKIGISKRNASAVCFLRLLCT